MAKIKVDWAKTELISIFDEARDLGFDLRKYDRQTIEVQEAMKKATIDRVVSRVRQAWQDKAEGRKPYRGFSQVKNGVYIISIGGHFGVSYPSLPSEVMYIGRGVFANRIRSHLQNWIFEMSLSLRDVPFRFYMDAIGDGRSIEAFKDFEHVLLDQFSSKFGDKPLLNKIHGRDAKIEHSFSGNCFAPLDNRGKTYLWVIRPTEKNAWFKEFRDD